MNYSIFTILICNLLLFIAGSMPTVFFRFHKSSTSDALNLFFSNLLVMLTCVGAYAICIDGLNTICCLIPLVLVVFFMQRTSAKNEINVRSSSLSILKYALPVLLTAVVAYIYIIPRTVENDVLFYSKVSTSLSHGGGENYFHFYNNLFDSRIGPMPYHYIELWFAALLSALFQMKSIVVLKYIVYPYLISVVIIGLKGLSDVIYKKQGPFYYTFVFLALTLLLAYFSMLYSYKCSGWDVVYSLWMRPNYILYFLGIIPMALSLYENDHLRFAFWASVTCLLSVTVMPALVATIPAYCLCLWLMKKIDLKTFLRSNALFFGFVVVFALFYTFHKTDVDLFESKPVSWIIAYSLKIWKATLGTYLNIAIRCLLPVAVFIWFYKKQVLNFNLVLFSGLFVVISVGVFQLLSQMDNSYQFPQVSYVLLAVLLMICLGSALYRPVALWKKAAVYSLPFIFAILLNSGQWISPDFWPDNRSYYVSKKGWSPEQAQDMANVIEKNKGLQGFYYDQDSITHIPMRFRTETTIQPLLELAYYTDKNNMVCLNTKEQMMHGSGRGEEILEKWYNTFPRYSAKEDPFDHMKDGQFTFLLITKQALDSISTPPLDLKQEKLQLKDHTLFVFYK